MLGETPSAAPGAVPFELDTAGWRAELTERAGLLDAEAELVRWEVRMDARAARAFHASTISVLERDERERVRVLDEIEAMVTTSFGGTVVRPFVTAIHTARRG
jgi:hypothetical protein